MCNIILVSGHGSDVSALAFGNDCKRLMSSSTDGCIFVWRVHPDITKSIRTRYVALRFVLTEFEEIHRPHRLVEIESHPKENDAPNTVTEQLAKSIEDNMFVILLLV